MDRVFEKSAGGIVYRKVGTICEVLLLERRTQNGSREHVLPKGHIEADERTQDTALREISEETGLALKHLSIVKFITKIHYSYIASYLPGSPLIDKDVYLFLVRYTGTAEPHIPAHEREHECFLGCRWYRIEDLASANLKSDVYKYIQKNLPYML